MIPRTLAPSDPLSAPSSSPKDGPPPTPPSSDPTPEAARQRRPHFTTSSSSSASLPNGRQLSREADSSSSTGGGGGKTKPAGGKEATASSPQPESFGARVWRLAQRNGVIQLSWIPGKLNWPALKPVVRCALAVSLIDRELGSELPRELELTSPPLPPWSDRLLV